MVSQFDNFPCSDKYQKSIKGPDKVYEMLRNQQDHFNVDVYTSKMKAIKNNFKVAKIYSSMGDTLWKCGLEEFVKGTK